MSDRRHTDAPDFNGLPERNGWERRVYLAGKLIRDVGVTTIMLGIFVGWASGWIPSPLTRMERDLQTHVGDMGKTTESLSNLAKELRERNRILRIQECSPLPNDRERRRCFGEVDR